MKIPKANILQNRFVSGVYDKSKKKT